MRRRRGLLILVSFVLISFGALAATFAAGNRPLLGLDLQGGVSVVLAPTGEVTEESLDQARQIIDQRVNALGVAEPEISRQGDNILVNIPGVADRDRALELVGQTAELRFRPVLAELPPTGMMTPVDPGAPVVPGDPTGPVDPALPVDPAAPPAVPVDPAAPTEQQAPGGPVPGEQGLRAGGPGELALGTQEITPPVTEVPQEAPVAPVEPVAPTMIDPATGQPVPAPVPGAAPALPGGSTLPPDVCRTGVPPDQDLPDQTVLLPQCDPETNELLSVYQLGPTLLSGESLETARATLNSQTGEWVVNPVFRGGPEGIDRFNAAAAQCNPPSETCPTGRLAIVLDGRVVSAPTIEEASFQRDQIQISGDFTEASAKDLATVLSYGALPVEFERQQAQIVSATLGRDALVAGLWAGLVGFILVAAYMIAFYRILGVLAVLKLVLEGALIWSVISYLGTEANLALTLAGVTGLIVSIGVSVDSNVVYYEHLKEDVRNGRTVRSATDKAFTTSFRTIVAADSASLLGAFLLWWLTVGPVRGFAFYLGLATVLDLLASYFVMRPAVRLATQSSLAQRRPGWFGLPGPPIAPGDLEAAPEVREPALGAAR